MSVKDCKNENLPCFSTKTEIVGITCAVMNLQELSCFCTHLLFAQLNRSVCVYVLNCLISGVIGVSFFRAHAFNNLNGAIIIKYLY